MRLKPLLVAGIFIPTVCISGFAPLGRLIALAITGQIIAIMAIGVIGIGAMAIVLFAEPIGVMASGSVIVGQSEEVGSHSFVINYKARLRLRFFLGCKKMASTNFSKNRSECIKVAWVIVIAKFINLLSRKSRLL